MVSHARGRGVDRGRVFDQCFVQMAEKNKRDAGSAREADVVAFGELVFRETVRRSLRQSPEARLAMLRASLRDAERRGMIPKRDRAAHEERLLWLIRGASSRN